VAGAAPPASGLDLRRAAPTAGVVTRRRRPAEDEGEAVEAAELDRAAEPAEWRVRALVLGAWLDYGLHGERHARAMGAAHERAGRPVELRHEALRPAADARPGQLGLPLGGRAVEVPLEEPDPEDALLVLRGKRSGSRA